MEAYSVMQDLYHQQSWPNISKKEPKTQLSGAIIRKRLGYELRICLDPKGTPKGGPKPLKRAQEPLYYILCGGPAFCVFCWDYNRARYLRIIRVSTITASIPLNST